MKTIVFTTCEEDIQNALRIGLKEKGLLFICSNYSQCLTARAHGFNARISSKYFDKRKSAAYFQKAETMARKWFKKIGDMKFNDVSLAETVAIANNHYFADYLRSKEIVENILREEKPQKIFVNFNFFVTQYRRWVTESFSLENILLREMAEKRGIEVIEINKKFSLPRLAVSQNLILFVKSFANVFRQASRKDILFFTHQYHLNNFMSLVKATNETSYSYSLVGQSNNQLNNYSSLQSFTKPWDLLKILLFYINCRTKLEKIFRSEKILWKCLRDKVTYTIMVEYPRTALQIIQTKRVLNEIKPMIVYTAAGTDILDQTLLRQAKKMGIKTVVPQHGIATKFEYQYYQGDVIPVWGTIPMQLYLKNGIQLNRLAVTGYHLFDNYRNNIKPVDGKKVVLFLATSPIGFQKILCRITQEEIFADFINGMKYLPDYRAIIRLHPGTPATIPQEIAKKLNYKKLLDQRNYSLAESIKMADLVITQATTAGIEAIIAGKKVVYFEHLIRRPKESNFFRHSGPVITNFLNLNKYLNAGIWTQYRNGRDYVIQNYLNGLDGKASERILSIFNQPEAN